MNASTSTTSRSRKRHSKTVRLAIAIRESFSCIYCGADVLGSVFHLDHVQPFSRGGSDALDNLVCSCPGCNLSKGSKDLSSWRPAAAAGVTAALAVEPDIATARRLLGK